MSSLAVAALLVTMSRMPVVADRPAVSAAVGIQKVEQGPPPKRFFPTLGRNLVDDVKHIPRRNSVYWLAAGSAATALVAPFDQEINEAPGRVRCRRHVLQARPHHRQHGGAGGRQHRDVHRRGGCPQAACPPHRHGLDGGAAPLRGIVQGIKVIVRRERPDRSSGFSFPSGHATITMAGATVLQQHLGWKAAVPTYAIAAYVAASRVHDNRHYASDVVAGAPSGSSSADR